MHKITPPEFSNINTDELTHTTKCDFSIEGYSLWRMPYGESLPDTVARALRVMHVRDFALRTLMPDVSQKFSSVDRARMFTTDQLHQRDAYLLTADAPAEGIETNAAGFGWFRPIIIPEGNSDDAQFDDFDLIDQLQLMGCDPRSYVTAAIEVFDGYRANLRAVDLIDAAISDYHASNGRGYEGVCVRVGTPRAVAVVEQGNFQRLTSEQGGGVFLRKF